MPVFITQGRYTSSALKGMAAKPENRATEVGKLCERHGGKLIGYYVTFGEYDWMAICDMPDAQSIFAVLATAGSGSGVSDMKTALALTPAEAMRGFEMAGTAAAQFRSAGAS